MRVRLLRAGTAAATVALGVAVIAAGSASAATGAGPASAAGRSDGWTVEAAGNRAGATLAAVAARGTTRWAVGSVVTPTGSRPLTERNTGSGWRVSLPNVGAAGGSLAGVAAVTAQDVWAVGASGPNPLALHYDGTRWRVVPTPPGGRLSAVAAVSTTDVWAVGSQPTGDGPGILVQHWNGHQWSVVDAPAQPPTDFNALTGLAVVNAHDIWAVGSRGDDFNEPLVEHWNGSAWQVVAVPEPPQPDPNDPTNVGLTAVTAVGAGNVWAVGEAGLIEHYDGHAWRIVTGPGGGTVRWAAVSARAADDIWVVGRSGTTPVSAHWTGTAWHPVPVPTGTTLDGVVAARSAGTTAVGGTGTGALILHNRR